MESADKYGFGSPFCTDEYLANDNRYLNWRNCKRIKMAQTYPINIWINEERYEKLQKVGLGDMTKDVLAGMRVLQIQCDEQQKDKLLALYPMAKFDSATTKSIELLPPEVKNRMFELVIEKKTLDVMNEFLK